MKNLSCVIFLLILAMSITAQAETGKNYLETSNSINAVSNSDLLAETGTNPKLDAETPAIDTDYSEPPCLTRLRKKKKKPTKVYKWTGYGKMRFPEDYTDLKDLKTIPKRDFLDGLKYIALNDAGDWYVSFGGQARWRFDSFRNYNFGKKIPNDDNYFLQRYFAHADVHMGNHFRVFTELKSAFVNEYDLAGGPRPASLHNEIDVHSVFADITLELTDDLGLLLRGGRWEMNYGVGRIFGCRNWSQLRRPLDGVKIHLAYNQDWWIEGFWANWVEVKKYKFFNDANYDMEIWGAYAHIDQKSGLPFNFETYVLAKDKLDTANGDDRRTTVGGRIFGGIEGLSLCYDIEGGYQFDYSGDVNVSAGFFAIESSYTFKTVKTTPWVTIGFDWASGDSDPTDDKIKTFEGVSPYGHYYFGYIDEFGRQNIISPWASIGCKPFKNLTTTVFGHWFWADESEDGIYSPCNCTKTLRTGGEDVNNYIGFELDLYAKYKFNHHLIGLVGYGYLWAGSYVDETAANNGGAADNIQRVVAQLQFTF
ncbi:MAG: alginate export family protein [Desulfobacteraceae bacterium]|nr:alginate export family protein [Desulfobacteraceae bacterium]